MATTDNPDERPVERTEHDEYTTARRRPGRPKNPPKPPKPEDEDEPPEPRGFARMTPEERHQMGKLGGYSNAAQHDMREIAAHARRGIWESYLRQADPDGKLPEKERIRRAQALEKAHYAKMSLARWPRKASRRADAADEGQVTESFDESSESSNESADEAGGSEL